MKDVSVLSDLSDESSQDEGVDIATSSDLSLLWIVSKGEGGYMHVHCSFGSVFDLEFAGQPLCRKTQLRSGFRSGEGVIAARELAHPWCPSCLSKLPASVLDQCTKK